VYDAETHALEPIRQYLRPNSVTCWYDDHTLAGGAPGAIVFLDLETDKVSMCELPEDWPKKHAESRQVYWRHRDGHWAVTERGLFGICILIRGTDEEEGYTGFALLRAAPDLAEGETIRIPHRSRSKPDPISVSNDGRWLAYGEDTFEGGRRRIWLASLLDGTAEEVRPPVDRDHGASPRFLPDSSALVFLLRAGVALCDLRTREWRILPIDGLNPRPRERRHSIGRMRISPDGRHASVLLYLPGAQRWLGVVDLATGKSWELPHGAEKPWRCDWLGHDKLLVLPELGSYVVMNVDGSGRRVLGEK
jgi:hypothetical protein